MTSSQQAFIDFYYLRIVNGDQLYKSVPAKFKPEVAAKLIANGYEYLVVE